MKRVARRESETKVRVTHEELFADRVKTEKASRQNGVDCMFIALMCFPQFAYTVAALRVMAADAIRALVDDRTYGVLIPDHFVFGCGGDKSYAELIAKTMGTGWGSKLHVRCRLPRCLLSHRPVPRAVAPTPRSPPPDLIASCPLISPSRAPPPFPLPSRPSSQLSSGARFAEGARAAASGGGGGGCRRPPSS